MFRVQAAKETYAGKTKKKKNSLGLSYKLGIGVGYGVRLVHKIRPVGHGGSIVFSHLKHNRCLFIAISTFTELFTMASDHTSQRALDPQS